MPTERTDLESFSLPEEDGTETAANIEDGGTSTGRKRRKGIYIPLDAAGAIDSARFKPESKSQLNRLIEEGKISGSASAGSFDIDSQDVAVVYDWLATGVRTVGKMFLKWPSDFADMVRYTEEQKKRMAEPTAKLMQRYSPEWLMKHKELVFWGMAVSACTSEMIESAGKQYLMMYPEILEQMRQRQSKPNGEAVTTPAAA